MIYQASPNTPSYDYIKRAFTARRSEYQAYLARVRRATGFADIKSFSGFTPTNSMSGRYEIKSIGVTPDTFATLDRKVWREASRHGGLVYVAPIRRTRKGKAIGAALKSCGQMPTHYDIHVALHVDEPPIGRFSLAQILYVYGHAFVYFDDRCRAERENPDLTEITQSEFDRLTDEQQ